MTNDEEIRYLKRILKKIANLYGMSASGETFTKALYFGNTEEMAALRDAIKYRIGRLSDEKNK